VPLLGIIPYFNISNLLFDGKQHRITDYAGTGCCKAFRIVDGEHLKMRLNVLEPGICVYFGHLGFDDYR
jgi:hypothetical protein